MTSEMTGKKNIFLLVFEWIVNCYDNSFFERIMTKIFGFFQNGAETSLIADFFRNHFSNGNLWNKSRTAAAVRFPFAFCRQYYHRHEIQIESIKAKSGVYRFLKNADKISMRDYGTVLLSLGAGMLFGIAIFMKWNSVLHIGINIFVFLCGLFLCLSDNSFSNLKNQSFIVKFLKKTISLEVSEQDKDRVCLPLPHIRVIVFFALIAGFAIFAAEPAGAAVGVIAAAAIIVILWKTPAGVFLFVPLSAILPTMALVGLVGLTFVSFVLHLLFGRRAEYVSTPFQSWIAVFLGLSCYAALSSMAVVSSMQILMVYIAFTLAYLLIVNTIKERSQWTALVILFVLAAAIVALYGIFQNFFVTSTTTSWVDEKMFSDIKTRVYSTLDNPNVLGQYFIMMIPIAFVLLLKMRGGFEKLLYTGCNLVMLACLMYTWSRGAWLGVLIGIAFFIILKDRRWLVLCIAGLLLMPSVLPASILERLTSIGNLKDSSTAYRVAVWIGSLRLLKDYWFCGIGIGPDAFLEIYPQYALGGAGFALHSHNFYIQWVVDMGIAGLFVYLGIIAAGFKQISQVKEKDTLIKNVLLAMSGALLGYLFHGMAENLWYNYRMILVFWIYFGVLQSGAMIAGLTKGREVIR